MSEEWIWLRPTAGRKTKLVIGLTGKTRKGRSIPALNRIIRF